MNYPEKARRVIQLEIDELQRLHARIDDRFAQAIDLLLACVRSRGKLIVCGVGKSGSIGRKLAATLNTPVPRPCCWMSATRCMATLA